MTEHNKITIGKVNEDLVSAMNGTFAAASEANDGLRAVTAAQIEKRGFTYPGDRHQSWGLGGSSFNSAGIGGPGVGRGLDLQLNGFSLQPFGIGTNNLLSGGNASSSVFSSSGANVRYSRSTHLSRVKMAMCVEAYKGFGIVKNVIDLMCNFASEGLSISHTSPSVQRFYQRWAESVDLDGRAKHGLRSYYKTGNVFIYTTMGEIDAETYTKMKSTRGSAVSTGALTKNKGSKKLIPWRYTFLNPFQMDLRGSKFFGESEWVFVLDEDTKSDIKNRAAIKSVDILDETDINLPVEFKKLNKDENVVNLDKDKLWTLHYMKDDHEDWADPMVWPVMNDIMYKNSLRSMDMSVVNSTINAITIFKLGDVKSGYVAPASHYKKLSEMLRTPTYSHNIVWNDAITMESNYPPIDKILSQDKYKSVDRDILAGLGIPGILVNGAEGGSFSNAFLQVRTLLERLEDGRTEMLKWINKQLRLIAEVMGHREIPIVTFGQMSLRDEEAQKKLIIQLIDRNLISAETVHEVFGLSTPVEVERMDREKKIAEDRDIMVKFGPYRDPMNFMDTEDTMNLENRNEMKKMRLQQKVSPNAPSVPGRPGRPPGGKQSGGPSGRPPGIDTKHEVKRETKPKGMGLGAFDYELMRSTALQAYEDVENYLTSLALKSRGVEYKKSLSKADRDGLEELISVVYSNISLGQNITENYIDNLLKSPSLNPVVGEYYLESMKTITSDTAESRRVARAIALVRYSIGRE